MQTVLIVDTRSHRKFLRTILISAGYQVEFACASSDLVATVGSSNPSVVLLTWTQSSTCAQTACMTLRRNSAKLPIIVLGPKVRSVAKIRLLEMGADDFVEEPFDDDELIARIRSLIRNAELNTNLGR